MGFWVGWQLWQKLSLVLAALITVVLIYAFCVLAYTRWETKKHAAEDARQKEEEAVLYPMLTRDDIPFGARALERGIQIEGIWVSNPNTPIPSPRQPGTPAGSQPSSPALKPLSSSPGNPFSTPALESAMTTAASMPPSVHPRISSELDLAPPYEKVNDMANGAVNGTTNGTSTLKEPVMMHVPVPVLSDSVSHGICRPTNDHWRGGGKRASFRSRIFHSSEPPNIRNARSGPYEPTDLELGSAPSDLECRVSTEYARIARTARTPRVLRRPSSEEFRRKMSQIFNDSIQMDAPLEPLQLSPRRRDEQRWSKRRSLLGQFRS